MIISTMSYYTGACMPTITHPVAPGIAVSRSAHPSRPIRERRQAAWLAAVLDIALQIGGIHDLDLLLHTIVARAQAAFGYDHVGLLLLEHGAPRYRAVAGALHKSPAASQPLEEEGLPAQALSSGA